MNGTLGRAFFFESKCPRAYEAASSTCADRELRGSICADAADNIKAGAERKRGNPPRLPSR
jgi:hypothetical protein